MTDAGPQPGIGVQDGGEHHPGGIVGGGLDESGLASVDRFETGHEGPDGRVLAVREKTGGQNGSLDILSGRIEEFGRKPEIGAQQRGVDHVVIGQLGNDQAEHLGRIGNEDGFEIHHRFEFILFGIFPSTGAHRFRDFFLRVRWGVTRDGFQRTQQVEPPAHRLEILGYFVVASHELLDGRRKIRLLGVIGLQRHHPSPLAVDGVPEKIPEFPPVLLLWIENRKTPEIEGLRRVSRQGVGLHTGCDEIAKHIIPDVGQAFALREDHDGNPGLLGDFGRGFGRGNGTDHPGHPGLGKRRHGRGGLLGIRGRVPHDQPYGQPGLNGLQIMKGHLNPVQGPRAEGRVSA